jgi:hypothetical protein
MFKSVAACLLGLLVAVPAIADEAPAPRHRPHYHWYYRLPAERHVIEVVSPPWSGRFIINGTGFTGKAPACFGWAAGERITLVAGDWHGECVEAVFYNYARHNTCQMWCGAGPSEGPGSWWPW